MTQWEAVAIQISSIAIIENQDRIREFKTWWYSHIPNSARRLVGASCNLFITCRLVWQIPYEISTEFNPYLIVINFHWMKWEKAWYNRNSFVKSFQVWNACMHSYMSYCADTVPMRHHNPTCQRQYNKWFEYVFACALDLSMCYAILPTRSQHFAYALSKAHRITLYAYCKCSMKCTNLSPEHG